MNEIQAIQSRLLALTSKYVVLSSPFFRDIKAWDDEEVARKKLNDLSVEIFKTMKELHELTGEEAYKVI